jgi:hypothetical protein
MKITIICGPDGKVHGTARGYAAAQGEPVAHLIAGPGQTAHEIELPKNLESIAAADALHAALEKHLKTIHPKR